MSLPLTLLCLSILVGASQRGCLSSVTAALVSQEPAPDAGREAREAYPELSGKIFRFSEAVGLGRQEGITRRDPSDIIKVEGVWYVWYTRVEHARLPARLMRLRHSGYVGTIWWATSNDAGHTWEERGEALGPGPKGAFDSFAVFTPNILVFDGCYYLYYTGVRPSEGGKETFLNDQSHDPTAIGVAAAKSPRGPFERLDCSPVLAPSPRSVEKGVASAFDSYRVDDAALVLRDHDRDGDLDVWLYYKGRNIDDGPAGPGRTEMGLVVADRPEGEYLRVRGGRPVLSESHEVLVWSHREGVAAYASISRTLEYAPDGIDFLSHRLARPAGPRPVAPGAFRPDLVRHATFGQGIMWGLAMRAPAGPSPFLVRFEIDLRVKAP